MSKLSVLRKDLLALLQKASSIGITTHVNPDGDGFCAALALQYLLSSWGKVSTIIIDPGTDLSHYQFLMQDNNIQDFDIAQAPFELMIVLDCNSMDRLGARSILVDKAKQVFLLDHHMVESNLIPSNFSYIDPSYASAGAILFELLQPEISALPENKRIQVANCIYVTILNDTNNFTNANTDAATFRLAASLQELGIKAHQLHRQFFMNHTPEEMRYVGQTLATIELHLQRRVLLMHSSLAISQSNALNPESVMSVTRWIQGVAGVSAIIYLREDAPDTYKVSLRSPTVDVNKIAIKYGGGGHRAAAGCTMHGSLATVSALLIADLQAAL